MDADLSDVKSISKCGYYLGQGSRCANKPEVDGYWIFIAFKSHDASFYPIYAMDSGNTRCYCGILSANSLTWNRLDNFGCSTPAALASLLGGLGSAKYVEDTNVIGTYFGISTGETLNKPTDNFTFVSFGDIQRQLCIQLGWTTGAGSDGERMWLRRFWNGWSDWKLLSFVPE